MNSILEQFIREYLKCENNINVSDSLTIYCDMDGVLVDFVKGTIERINAILDGNLAQDELAISKSMRKAVRKIAREKGEEWRVGTKEDIDFKPVRELMMSYISFNPGEYYGTLPKLNDGVDTLWPFLTSTGYQVNILSAPVEPRKGLDVPTAEMGKKDWVAKNLSPQPKSVIVLPAKRKREFATINGI